VPLSRFTSGRAQDVNSNEFEAPGVWLLGHSGTYRVNIGPIRGKYCRPNPRSSGPKSDNVDMTVPSNYSAAPSGDLCSTFKRFFDAVRWENRKSVRTRADRPESGGSGPTNAGPTNAGPTNAGRSKAVGTNAVGTRPGRTEPGRSAPVRGSSVGLVGLPCRVEGASAKLEILSATRDEMKRGGLHADASPCGTAFSRTVLFAVIARGQSFHQKSNTGLASGNAVRSNVARSNGSNIAVSSAIGSSMTGHRHPSGPPRNSFFT